MSQTPEEILGYQITPSKFVKEVEAFVAKTKESYIDAIIHICDKNGIEYETAGEMVRGTSVLKSKVKADAKEKNYLPKTAKLPI